MARRRGWRRKITRNTELLELEGNLRGRFVEGGNLYAEYSQNSMLLLHFNATYLLYTACTGLDHHLQVGRPLSARAVPSLRRQPSDTQVMSCTVH